MRASLRSKIDSGLESPSLREKRSLGAESEMAKNLDFESPQNDRRIHDTVSAMTMQLE